jgi:hypothetical protein
MGADILYLSPCCKTEDWQEIKKDGIIINKCSICGEEFLDLIQETIDYKDED